MFDIITGHGALRWLMTQPNLAGRLHWWSLTLQEYEFIITYRPGATNVEADTLARAHAVAPAAVLAVVGAQLEQRPRMQQMHEARKDSKSEEDEPLTVVAKEEADAELSRRCWAGGATIPMSTIVSQAIDQCADGVVNGDNAPVREMQVPRLRPWTQLARRQAEARAATVTPTVTSSETANKLAERNKNGTDEHHRQYEKDSRKNGWGL
ncbi:unnamed protein product [Phytophthora fragariaefolia]|uniref:Unnamed protein product n=1 Tax=Phytophthora fragariaefolia TaxID=1490495 RepID=A0A9W6XY16_9STRA|nr:unnamed protein product [Phytophthora fragariaefolia]